MEWLKQLWFEEKRRSSDVSPGSLLQGGLIILESVYRLVWALRAAWFRQFPPPHAPDPIRVIAVGNLIVGGAGKTPCTLALAQALRQGGITCGLLSRGYRSQAESNGPVLVLPEDLPGVSPQEIGDEAWLLCWRSGLPIAVGKNRWAGLQALLRARPQLQAIVLDDGLQQQWLASDRQVLVVDGRGFGNGRCLPAGPLREPIGDLSRFSLTVHRNKELMLNPCGWLGVLSLAQGKTDAQNVMGLREGILRFQGQRILAAAGIAAPQRFFDELRQMGLDFEALALSDHAANTLEAIAQRWSSGRYDTILMTEKDAVKFFNSRLDLCAHAWALRQEPALDSNTLSILLDGLKTA